MKKIFPRPVLLVALVLTASLVFSGCLKTESGQKAGSQFVLMDDAKQVQEITEGQTMYQTNGSVSDVLAFYRNKMTAEGLIERDLLTVETDTSLNLVFDGSENGKALVIQATVLPDGNTNVVVRFEEV